MKRQILPLAFTLSVALSGQAMAQITLLPPPSPSTGSTNGEVSQVLTVFYECVPGPVVGGLKTWAEVTELKVANLTAKNLTYDLFLLDDDQNFIAEAEMLPLTPGDLDITNICESLAGANIAAPHEGLLIAVSSDFGVYGWAKNFLGKFFVGHPDPFDGRVASIAKLEARLVEHDVVEPLLELLNSKAPPVIPLAKLPK